MSWSDKEIDKLFKENADANSFEYKNEYWNEMEALLPSKTGRDMLWMFTSFAFIGFLLTSGVVGNERMLAMNENNSKEKIVQIAENGELDSQENNDSVYSEIEENKISEKQNSDLDKSLSNSSEQSSYEISQTLNNNRVNDENTSQLDSNSPNNRATSSSIQDFEQPPYEEVNTAFENDLVTTKNSESENLILEQVDVLSFKEYSIIDGSIMDKDIQFTGLPSVAPIKPVQSKLYLAALGGVSQSLITPSEILSTSFGLGAGVNFRKGNLTLNLGLNGIVAIHDDIVLNRESKVYGFGSNYYRYELKYKNIFTLEGDLSLGYNYKNNLFSIGIRPSYALGTKVTLRTQENESDMNLEQYFGYFEGLNRFGLKPMLGYAYNFKSGISLGLNVGVQMNSLINEQYVDGMSNRFPLDGQLVLKKTLNLIK